MWPTDTLSVMVILLLTLNIPALHGSTVHLDHYPLRSSTVPSDERRTLNILVWAGPLDMNVSITALKFAMARVEENNLLPDIHMVQSCRTKGSVLTSSYLGIQQFIDARDVFEEKYNSKIHAIIGPYSTKCFQYIGQVLAFYNVPVIAFGAMGSVYKTERKYYPTLSRVAYSSSSIANGLLKFVKFYNWTQVAILSDRTGRSTSSRLAGAAAREIFEANNITVNYYSWINKENFTRELMLTVKNSARIIILSMPHACNTLELQVLLMAEELGMLNGEYVFITMHSYKHRVDGDGVLHGWCTNSSLARLYSSKDVAKHVVKLQFKGFSDYDLQTGRELFEQHGPLNEDGLVGDMFLADATYVAFDAIGRMLANNSWSNITDGALIQSYAARGEFKGMLHPIYLDEVGDRVAEYIVEVVDRDTGNITNVMNVDIEVHCFACGDGTMKLHLNTTLHYTLFLDGDTPLDEPLCGFDNAKCDYTNEAIAGLSSVALVVGILIFIKLRQITIRNRQKAMIWRINMEDIDVIMMESTLNIRRQSISTNKSASSASRMSLGSMYSNMNSTKMLITPQIYAKDDTTTHRMQHIHGMFRGVHVLGQQLHQTQTLANFDMGALKLLEQLRHISMDTVNVFIGISFNQNDTFTILWKFEARCTLHQVLGNTDFNLSNEFQTSFLNDMVTGIDYLHSSAKICHGNLNGYTCLVTPQWTVRLSCFGLNPVLKHWVKQKCILVPRPDPHELLHIAPELIHSADKSCVNMCYVHEVSNSGDLFALGVLAYEIVNRKLIEEETSDEYVTQELTGLASRQAIDWAVAGKMNDVRMNDLDALFEACTEFGEEQRPPLDVLKRTVHQYMKEKFSRGNGIVDHMMKMMQTYATDLEKLVDERTASLEETQLRADRLLHQLLPKSVAEDLKAGRTILPELYDSATIGFTDIVSFTKFCSGSTPIQIVSLLNDMFSQFDALVTTQDVYKVETIGDAYMIVSGIPARNGIQHAHEICVTLLGMVQVAMNARVAHMGDDFRLGMRGGVHTGPVAAGVVGIHAPRYCLFGDTVNTASRMESNSVPNKVQISESTRNCLSKSVDGSKLAVTLRGPIAIKGKGEMVTYFLA